MSVINSMLRDLDRRHAPLPFKADVQPAFENKSRRPTRAIAWLCALALIGGGIALHATQKNRNATIAAKTQTANSQTSNLKSVDSHTSQSATHDIASHALQPVAQTSAPAVAIDANGATATQGGKISNAPRISSTAVSAEKNSAAQSSDNAAQEINIAAAPTATENVQPLKKADTAHRETEHKAGEKTGLSPVRDNSLGETQIAQRPPAPIVKQERKTLDDLNGERYQLARAALVQNQTERAYELLRDDPPPLANALDYHAVLAAVEQQLGHYADAILRYQQLLALDQTQASWWLGLALSLEGEHRRADALAAYRRATALNSLPDAARQYALARVAALSQ